MALWAQIMILFTTFAATPMANGEERVAQPVSDRLINGAAQILPSKGFSKSPIPITGDVKCKSQRPNDLANQAKQLAKVAETQPQKLGPRGYSLGRSFSASCSKFIDKNGAGPWGELMISAARRVAPQCFYNRNLFGSLCPNYLSLSVEQKDGLIALAFAAIAESESNCNPNVPLVRGVNGAAVGIFQLEHSAKQRADAGRNSTWCPANSKVNTRSWEFQSQCAVSIVEDTVCSWRSVLFDAEGYWEKLRNNRAITQRIRSTIKKWGYCGS